MDPVSTLNQVLALLRQQVVDRTRRPSRRAGREVIRDGKQFDPRAAGADLRTLLEKRIGALHAAGIDDTTRLSRAVIDVALRHEFGARLGNEPEFQEMVEWVCKGVMEDGSAAALVGDVVREIGRGAGTR
ncbi:hypothetical protein [Burkholderia stagnalis]|uniref:hypothetical protein n=1 Tax=Burkholderia stagnalis TaxID=1503054 RepID=UPI00075D6CCA|nr:hypothetical protein [Burkholderia stagnalis]KVC64681.1 hypothetical protein WS59_15635 [Burkholderia stagnalis]KVN14635.1 hypothetical protein WT10_25700 [Burkholderia stagnalis]KWI66631.1 hypothetical protein WT75_25895 [Burkholderia stagnalis]KWK73746.1 hypothetical protein WT82_04925 [Burkholderia stagnalis]KWN13294.1 hypothetical protein WT84_02610 [Burkholderia stagnalis]